MSEESHTPGLIALAGFMGTGKSTVGRILAKRLGRPFLDVDTEIETREGRAISDIFATDGEPVFRAIERALIREVSQRRDRVVAVGGGAVLDPDNVKDLSKAGLLVCLDARPEVVWRRVQHEHHRPLLQTDNPEQRIRVLLARRTACYAAIPFHVDTSERTPDEVADVILRRSAFPHAKGRNHAP